MNNKLRTSLEQIIPFFILGIAIALMVGLIVVFSYVVLWGLLLGGILWCIASISRYFTSDPKRSKEKGRVIEHDDKS